MSQLYSTDRYHGQHSYLCAGNLYAFAIVLCSHSTQPLFLAELKNYYEALMKHPLSIRSIL